MFGRPQTVGEPGAARQNFAGDRGWLLGVFLVDTAVLAAFAYPYLLQMDRAIPAFPFVPDEKLIVWILSWVTHALSDPNLSVYNANIYHPAPAQLTGSEHLFALQLLFAPIYSWTKEPVLSTAIVASLTYPLAAALMTALLVRVGCARSVAWVCGLAYAVGMLRVPLNFHVLQYPNLLLPLVAIGVVQARDAPGPRRGLWLFLFTLAALLTSYYIAVIALLAMGCWVLAELLDSRPRLAFFLTVTVTTLTAAAVASFALQPYLERSEHMLTGSMMWQRDNWRDTAIVAHGYYAKNASLWVAPFACLVIFGLPLRHDPNWRRLALPAALVLLLGAGLTIFGLPGWLRVIADHTPLRNFRAWLRLLLLFDFGLYLLAAAGLEACRRRFGLGVALIPLAAFAAVATPRLQGLSEWPTFAPQPQLERRAAYKSLDLFKALGKGAVLELPSGTLSDSEAMLGSTLHWRPLVNGFTGYAAAHTVAVRNAIAGLPARSALQELIDLTRLSWIFLRPAEDWHTPGRPARLRDELIATGLVGQVFANSGFILISVTAPPVHENWYAALSEKMKPGHTAMGTPLSRLPLEGSVASIEQIGAIRASSRANTFMLPIRLANEGTADWPALASLPYHQLGFGRPLMPFEVYLLATWTPLDADDPEVGRVRHEQQIQLKRDVPAGEKVVQTLAITTPTRAGNYQFDVRVVQKNGIDFYEPPSRLYHEVFEIQVEDEEPAEEPAVIDDLGIAADEMLESEDSSMAQDESWETLETPMATDEEKSP